MKNLCFILFLSFTSLLTNAADFDEKCNLAKSYRYGENGIAKDVRKALSLYLEAFAGGSAKAAFYLSDMYYNCPEIENSKESDYYLKVSVAKGYPEAQTHVGSLYEETPHPDDLFEAAKLYTLAAHQGHAPAQYALGILYIEGRGVTKDREKGLQLINSAADANFDAAKEYIRNLEK